MPYIAATNALLNPETVLTHLPLTAGMRVGDLGCGGHGQFAVKAARLVGQRGMVYVVDIRKSALAEITKKARLVGVTNVKPIWANLELVGSTGIPPGTLDAAMLINVLFQTPDRASLFLESKRLLNGGGTLVVVDWKTAASPLGPALERRITPLEVSAHATAAGFQLRETFDAGPYHYGLAFTKP